MSKKGYLQVNIESGCRLKNIREKRNMTQEEFAAELGVTGSAYKKLESGENGISTKRLRQLKTMNVSSDFILYGEDDTLEELFYKIENSPRNVKRKILLKLISDFAREEMDESQDSLDDMLLSVLKKSKL